MSQPRSIGKGPYELPSNVVYLEFPRTDGQRSRWPQNTTEMIDPQGHVNFMLPVPDLETSLNRKWRVEVGKKVAEMLRKPSGPNYVLKTYPEGYRMFDHHKGHRSNPRHDVYLFGSTTLPKFRSVPEFIPHAFWLFSDPMLDNSNCQCKYCTNSKAQRPISDGMGLTSSSIASSSMPKLPIELKERTLIPRQIAMKKPSAPKPVVQRPIPLKQPAKSKQPLIPSVRIRRTQRSSAMEKLRPGCQQIVSQQRDCDMRAISAPGNENRRQRQHRVDEILWCRLRHPIFSENSSIEYWPGWVEKYTIKSQPVLKHDGSGSTIASHEDGTATWDIKQWVNYKMHFLAVDYTEWLSDEEVLPLQAYEISQQLISALEDIPIAHRGFGHALPPTFFTDEASMDLQDRFFMAAGLFMLAHEIARHIRNYWAVTDEWRLPIERGVVIEASVPQTTISSQYGDLVSALSAAGAQNELASLIAGQGDLHRNDYHSKEHRWQGMFWGGERIWADEVVRLKPASHELTPSPHLLFPLPRQALSSDDSMKDLTSANSGTLFMRIHSIYFIHDSRTPNTLLPQISGTLFDLVLKDWTGPGISDGSDIRGSDLGMVSASSAVPKVDQARRQVVPYTLPPAPLGCKFRALLKSGFEFVICPSVIAGRYYPNLFSHPLFASQLRLRLSTPEKLLCLSGLLPGRFNAIFAIKLLQTRHDTLLRSEETAQAELQKIWSGQDEMAAGITQVSK